ncbi:MAG TPA: cupredoxin domain-containing protein [Candidatus Limnocylindrales bacterium]|nr:cupredoxin domain-containing protein [Candidatus Limnocylindrales bacterium]
MTDQTPAPVPGRAPEPGRGAEERLPATVPQGSLSADRFSAPPSIKANAGLTPQRSAGIVRQSASARWVGLLTVIFVSLFIVGYWFYELGAPAGISKPRLATEIEAQQVTDVERGYNLFEANCARCHGPGGLGPNEPDAAAKSAAGQGYIGPQLNAQEKLFAHLNAQYLRNVLTVGGRYVCGNANSAMPVWSDKGSPAGPLNYRQIDELIAFLRATSDKTYDIRDGATNEPVIDPATGKVKTFTGWRDLNYKPAAGATPYPDCYLKALTGGAGSSGAPASGGPAASVDANAPTVTLTAENGAATAGFKETTLTAKADTAFSFVFDNQDPTVPHNVVITDPGGSPVAMGDTSPFQGPEKRTYSVPALHAGTYTYVCQVHPSTMKGTLEVK